MSTDKSVIETIPPIKPSKYIDKLNNTIFLHSAEDTKDLNNISSTTIRHLLQGYYHRCQSVPFNTTSSISSAVSSTIETEIKTVDTSPQTNKCSEIYEQLQSALHADVLHDILEHNRFLREFAPLRPARADAVLGRYDC